MLKSILFDKYEQYTDIKLDTQIWQKTENNIELKI